MAETLYFGTVLSAQAKTTQGGVAYVRESLAFGQDAATAYVPTRVVDGSEITLVIYAHGYGATEADLDTAYAITRDGMLSRGWVIVAGRNGGQVWGNQKAMDQIASQRAWAGERWQVRRVILWGGSMGGLTVLNALGRNLVAGVAATIAYVSVVDSSAMGSDFHASIMSAYGAASMAEVPAKAAGYDPARDDPQKWANKPIFLNQGTTDAVVVKAKHGDAFMARAVTPDKITYNVSDHAHSVSGLASVENAALAFADLHAPAYVAPSTDPGPPPPSGGGTTDPVAPSGSGVYWSDGREASLYRADGTLVRLGRL